MADRLNRHDLNILAIAGRDEASLFSDDAIALIHDTSRGPPRAVSNLCLQALIAACASGQSIVGQTAARAAIAEVTATP